MIRLNLASLLRELALPLTRPAVLFAMILFYVMFEIALLGRIFGIVIAAVLAVQLIVFALPAMLRYLMIVLEARTRGRDPEPLTIDLLSWVGSAWSLFPIVHIAVFIYTVYLGGAFLGAGTALGIALLYAAILPASLIVLAITHSPLESIRPAAVFGLIRRRGAAYLVAPAFTALALALLVWINVRFNIDALTEFVSFYLIFAAFALYGGLVQPLQLEDEVDIPLPASIDEDREAERHLLERSTVLDHAYGLISRGNREGGLAHIYAELAADQDEAAGWAWFFDKLMRWERSDAGLEFAQHYLHRLLQHGEIVPAVKVMLRARLRNPAFRPLAEDLDPAISAASACRNEELVEHLRG